MEESKEQSNDLLIVQEGYLIENGKIAGPLKSATLISTGPKVLKQISMVGQDLELEAGMCGSVSGAVGNTARMAAARERRAHQHGVDHCPLSQSVTHLSPIHSIYTH